MAEKYLFPRLNQHNYQTWKTRMEMTLKREDLWYVISQPKPNVVPSSWTKADEKCFATIVLYIEDSQLNLVKDCPSAMHVWEKIKEYHQKATMTSRVSLLKKICSLNLVEGGDMEAHLFELEELFDRLTCAGQAMENSLKIAMIHRSLPDSYGNLVTALESRPEADITIDFVKQRILDEHQRRVERSGDNGEKAMKVQSKGKKEVICFHCQKPGHFRRNCKLLQQQQHWKKGESEASKAKKAVEKDSPAQPSVCFSIGGGRSKGCWYIDSGCSSHMTSDRKFFCKLDESVRIDVVLADGSVTKSCGIGEGTVKCIDGEGKAKEVTFKDVLFIPTLDSGLVSVSKLTQKGFAVQFSGASCNIVNTAGKVDASGELNGNMFVLKTADEAMLSAECQEIRQHLPNCQHIWHRRFGHRDPAVLEQIKAKELGAGFETQDCGIRNVCEHCLAGKSARIPFPKASENRADRILDLVHTDVCGPIKSTTPGGNRYLMTLIDDFSRYTVVCLLRQKSDAAGCIRRFVAHVKNRFGRAPCVIRSDGGGEYVNHELKQFYEKEGIQAQFTAAYSPQQNGVAERKNRTLQEMATCMLLDAGLERKYWGEAIVTAAYIQNRMPSRSVDTTPYEKWFGRKPTLKHFRVFGSPAYVHIPAVKRSKLERKAQKLVFVGYCEDRKAYRFLDPSNDAITISRDARFIELNNGSLNCGDTVDDGVAIGLQDLERVEGEAEADCEVQEEPGTESEEEFYGFDNEEQVAGQEEPTAEGFVPTNNRPKRSTRGQLPHRLADYEVDVGLAVEQSSRSDGRARVTHQEQCYAGQAVLWR